jgi:hypothetical protein
MKKTLIYIEIGLLIFAACLIASRTTNVQAAASGATIFIDPSEIEPKPLTFFQISVSVANISDLYAGDFAVYYTHAQSKGTITVSGVEEGAALSAQNVFWDAAFDNNYNETHGMIHVAWTMTGNVSGLNITGKAKIALAVIDCAAMAPGQSAIVLSNVTLLDSKISLIAIDPSLQINGQALIGLTEHPDIAVLSVKPLKNFVEQNLTLGMQVKVANLVSASLLNQNQTFDVSIYYNATKNGTFTFIGNLTVKDLQPGETRTSLFDWSTVGVPVNNYTITAIAPPLPLEINVDNNNATSCVILIPVLRGDVWGPGGSPDGLVNILDLSRVAAAYPSAFPDAKYDPNLDVKSDGKIDIADLADVAHQFT